MNNDFCDAICQWFSHSWKSLANRLTRDPKIVIYGNSCIILYIFIMEIPITGLYLEMGPRALIQYKDVILPV